MQNVPKDLGRRIEQAAALAVRLHLEAALAQEGAAAAIGGTEARGDCKLAFRSRETFHGGVDLAGTENDEAWLAGAIADLYHETEAR